MNEENFEDVEGWWCGNCPELVVDYKEYKLLLNAYKELKERHQRLLNLAGSSYL